MSRPDDCSLTPGQLARVRKEAERALREAGALGVLPTPVERIMTVAKVEEVKDEVLSPGFIAKLRSKAEHAGQALKRAVSKVLGIFQAASGLVFLDRTLMAVKKRFVRLHESGHGFMPWQRSMYALVEDCEKALDPEAADIFDSRSQRLRLGSAFPARHISRDGGRRALRNLDADQVVEEIRRVDLRVGPAICLEEPPRLRRRRAQRA
jgi:hypothetical protein